MPILNLSKVKKEGTTEVKEEVPDELPSLPAQEEHKEDKKPEDKAETVEIAPKEESRFAPDELPPIKEAQIKTEEESEEKIAEEEEKQEDIKPKILDERLYFSNLIKRLNEGVGIDEIEKEIRGKDIITALSDNLAHNRKIEDKSKIEKDIKSMIIDLQKLEKEWASLKKELELKKTKFEETENKIREYTDNIKKKFSDIDDLKKQF
jgi:hypothetical protein